MGGLKNYLTKIKNYWIDNILNNKNIRLLFLLPFFCLVVLLSYYANKQDFIITDKLIIKSVILIFVNNSILFSGYEFYGLTTLIMGTSNSIFIGSKIIPAFFYFYHLYSKIWIFVVLEIIAYLLGSYVGFSNGKVKHKKSIYLIGLLLLLVSAYFENITLISINCILDEIL